MAEENSSIEKLAEMIKDHQHIVFFGGAGVSTESAIPDFRGKNGLYYQKVSEKWSPEEMLSHHFYRSIRICFSLCTRKWRKQSAMRSLMRRTGHWQSLRRWENFPVSSLRILTGSIRKQGA